MIKEIILYASLGALMKTIFFSPAAYASSNEENYINRLPHPSAASSAGPFYPPELLFSPSCAEESSSLLHYDPQRNVYYSINGEEMRDDEVSLEPYLKDIEKISNRSLTQNQQEKLLGCFAAFKFRKSPYEILKNENLNEELDIAELHITNLRTVWKQKTQNKKWPRYKKDFHYTLNNSSTIFRKKRSFYDVYFIIPLSVGGPIKWWNIFPLTPYQIQTIRDQSNIFYFLFSNQHEKILKDELEDKFGRNSLIDSNLHRSINGNTRYLIKTANDESQYLAINGLIKSNSYQWCFFGTKEYINSDTSSYIKLFHFLPQEDNSYCIRSASEKGNNGYLMTGGSARKNPEWQWAYFGASSYISSKNSKFSLNFQEDESICIKSIEESGGNFLAFDYSKRSSPWQWAFFGSPEYIDASASRYLTNFFLIPVGEES